MYATRFLTNNFVFLTCSNLDDMRLQIFDTVFSVVYMVTVQNQNFHPRLWLISVIPGPILMKNNLAQIQRPLSPRIWTDYK